MDKERQAKYIEHLQRMIRIETVSDPDCGSSEENFAEFRELLWELFPALKEVCEFRDFDGALLLRWKGSDHTRMPVLFMNHYDVVPARTEGWKHPPFAAEIADGKIWGRGTLDDKGGLWAMFEAANELASEGFVPKADIWFEADNSEETFGTGAQAVAAWMHEQGMRFGMVLDEGGDIVREPISGAKGTFAMIGVGEKSVVTMKFTARSSGGHASTPEKNTPLARLGKFMAYVDRHQVFDVDMPQPVAEMLNILGQYMGRTGKVLDRAGRRGKALARLLPAVSSAAGAMVSTTIAFTMCGGGEAVNVIPSEAWVIGDMRCSHHQGQESSIKAISKIAKKFGLETEVIQREPESRLSDFRGEAFLLVRQAVRNCVPGVDDCAPYVMTGGSDARFFDKLSDQCIRFLPFTIDAGQMDSIHGINEYVSVDTLVPAVDFYRFMYQNV